MTELTWEGKYKDGKKVAPVKIALPFQTIETVNESIQERQKMLDLFSSGQQTDWRNRLIWGDKKYVLPSLLPKFAGKVNLIYIDPPFDTGADFSFTATIPDNPATEEDETTIFTKEPSILEQKAYRDTWGKGLDSYLQWFYETAIIFHELLSDNGTIYIHLDWHIGHYAKAILDDVFGYDNFRNEILVKRVKKNVRERELVKSLNVAVDSIFFYAKNVKPFIVQNLGKYERQAWQVAEFSETQSQQEKELRYRKFILELYKAEPITGNVWLHGVKNARMVHVGTVDSPVTLSDVKSIATEVWKSVGKGKDSAKKAAVDILGWEFAFEINELAKQVAAELKVDVAFKKIPREVLEKKAVEQGDIKFFELASISVDIKKKGREISLKLDDLVIPPDDVPEDVQKAITHWSQWIDYWAVDWDYKGDTFHNEWQSFRTRKDLKLELSATHNYESAGEYDVLVKVIDILGNDTTKMVRIGVK